MSLRKFEFPTKELAKQFISAHQSETERRDIIGPMRFVTATNGDLENPEPTEYTGWLVDTVGFDPEEEWSVYEVFPQTPFHVILGFNANDK